MTQNYGLGRGLASLIPQKNKKISEPKENFNYFGTASDPNGSSAKNSIREIDINLIETNPHQPRFHFDEEKLKELSDSIKEHGIIQPITVSKNDNHYEIIAGERRFKAAKMAGFKTVPVIIKDVTEQQKLEMAVIENIQRHDLNPIEEARACLKLIDDFDMSQEEVSSKVGKSRSAVANKLRLLSLPVEIQKSLIEEKITEGHAKAILALSNPEKQKALFEMILKNNLTVRQTENKTKETTVKSHKRTISVDPEIVKIENEMSEILGTKVKLSKSGVGGRIIIDYYSKEELENIINRVIGKN